MGSIAGDDVGSVGGGKEERILVSVRIRPLNGKEIERNDPSDWECINNNTVIFKNSLPDRAMYPGAYTFGEFINCIFQFSVRNQHFFFFLNPYELLDRFC